MENLDKAHQTEKWRKRSTTWNNVGAGEFLLDLQDFFYARQDRLRPELLSEEYHDNREEVLRMCEELQAILDEDAKFKLMNFNNAYNNLETITKELSYRQGFSDGVRFIIQSLVAGA